MRPGGRPVFRRQMYRLRQFLRERVCGRGSDPFATDPDGIDIDHQALETAKRLRGGPDREGAIVLLGVMPRSGTVYTGELIRLHPQVHAYPYDLWEVPFLELTGDFLAAQDRFFRLYQFNRDKIGQCDMLPLFGAAFLAYLHNGIPPGKTLLIKNPDMAYLKYFSAVFPFERLVLLLRDGRDLVHSTVKTWPEKDFSQTCRLWQRSTKLALEYSRRCGAGDRCLLVKYEDVVADPHGFVRSLCATFGLNPDTFPFDAIDSLPMRGSSSAKKDGKVSWDPVKPKQMRPTTQHWVSWNRKRKNTFKRIAGDTLIEAGYADDMGW